MEEARKMISHIAVLHFSHFVKVLQKRVILRSTDIHLLKLLSALTRISILIKFVYEKIMF